MLSTYIMQSSFNSVRDSVPLSIYGGNKSSVENRSSVSTIEMAQFALEILGGSFYSLSTISDEIELVSGILASIFVIDWNYGMEKGMEDEVDVLEEKLKDRLEFGQCLHDFRYGLNDRFWRSLSIDIRKNLLSNLVHFIRSVVFKEDELGANRITALCYTWVLELLETLCYNLYEKQSLLDQLLRKDDTWPLWIVSDFSTPTGSSILKAEYVHTNTAVSAF